MHARTHARICGNHQRSTETSNSSTAICILGARVRRQAPAWYSKNSTHPAVRPKHIITTSSFERNRGCGGFCYASFRCTFRTVQKGCFTVALGVRLETPAVSASIHDDVEKEITE